MIYDEKKVEALSENVLKKIREKIKSEIADAFYSEMSDYLYEHYDNAADRVRKLLMDELVEDVNSNPKNTSFKPIRDKIFSDNKDIFLEYITDEKIKESIEKIIWGYDHRKYPFSWKWEEYVAKHIKNNLSEYAKSDMVLSELNAEIEALTRQVTNLEELIDRLRCEIEEG